MSTFFWISYVTIWVILITLLLLNLILFRQMGLFIMGSARGVNKSGISIGKKIPLDITNLESVKGKLISTAEIKGNPTLIFFASTHCAECKSIFPYIEKTCRDLNVIPVYFFFSDIDSTKEYLNVVNPELDAISISQHIGDKFDVEFTPFAYAVDENGVVQDKGLVNALHRLEEMVSSISKSYQKAI